MRLQWLAYLLLGCLAYGQATAPTTPSAPPAQSPAQSAPGAQAGATEAGKPAEVNLAPTDAVITLKGLCDNPAKQGASCQTIVTREQFEKVADTVQPNMPPAGRRQLATQYSRVLAMSLVAEKKGLDKQPQFDEMMRLARLQILAQALGRSLQEEAQKVPDAEIEKYYNDNKATYEEATLLRIIVPKTKQAEPSSAPKPGAKGTAKPGETKEAPKLDLEAQKKADEAAMKKVAASLQARAVAGEDFEKLQKEAYAAAGVKGTAPQVKMEKIRRAALPPTQSAAFDLKPGAVSAVIDDAGGEYIYKLVSKETLSLDAAKAEIHNALAGQRFRDAMQAVQQQGNAELNDAYFGPATPAVTTPPMMPPQKAVKPPAQGGKPERE